MRTREEIRHKRLVSAVWAIIFVSLAIICFWIIIDLATACGVDTVSLLRYSDSKAKSDTIYADGNRPTGYAEYQATEEDLILAKKSIAHRIDDCRITGYCACCTPYSHMNQNENGQVLTASGAFVNIGVVVAVDPDVIPLGSAVIVDNREYYALDTGVTGNAVDILMTHEDAHQAGVKYDTVYWIPQEEWCYE